MKGDKIKALKHLVVMLGVWCILIPCVPLSVGTLGCSFELYATYGNAVNFFLLLVLVWSAITVGIVIAGIMIVIKCLHEVKTTWVNNKKQLLVMWVGAAVIILESLYGIFMTFYEWQASKLYYFGRLCLVTFLVVIVAGFSIYTFKDTKAASQKSKNNN